MNQETEDRKQTLDTIIRQEEALQFPHFSFEDAWNLGLVLRGQMLSHGGNAAGDITVGGVQLFRCTVGEPTPNNTRWIRRKMNVALENWKSSMRATLEMGLSGRTPEEFGLRVEDFAYSGGCFPLRVKGQGVIGTITVSGFPQTHDHQTVVNALAEFLSVEVPSIL